MYTKRQLAEMYVNYLIGEGYRPEIDEDGDVRFKVEGKVYYILVHEDDPTYFSLYFPNFWEVESEEERTKVRAAVCDVNTTTKVVKLSIGRDSVSASIEMFCSPPENFASVFERCLLALQAGVMKFPLSMLMMNDSTS